MNIRIFPGLLLAASILTLSACTTPASQTTHDGLIRQTDSGFNELYLRPGATLAGYTEYGLAPCTVAFRKNWLRDQNQNRVDLGNRVTQKDVDRIKDALAGECDTFFRAALTQEPAYPLVDDFDEGQGVLVLHPSIINLDINAPDIPRAGRSRSFTTSSGEMTLLLELTDGTTGEVLARVVDRRRGMDTGHLQWTNGVTNKADADRTLRRWSKQLREGLDRAGAL